MKISLVNVLPETTLRLVSKIVHSLMFMQSSYQIVADVGILHASGGVTDKDGFLFLIASVYKTQRDLDLSRFGLKVLLWSC